MMDVDTPNILKRSSSAPLINEAASTVATSPAINTAPRYTSLFSMFNSNSSHSSQRVRRFSFSSSPLASPVVNNTTNVWAPRRTPRVNQLREEEYLATSNTREVAHERDLHTTMQMGQSCEDLTLDITSSPTRTTPTPTARFTAVVSPSPTRRVSLTQVRRSLSPVLRAATLSPVARPAALGLAYAPCKRRCDDADSPMSPLSKRMCAADRLTPSAPSTPPTPDSDSLDCTFRPVSPRLHPRPLHPRPDDARDMRDNHESLSTS